MTQYYTCKLCGHGAPASEWCLEYNYKGGIISAGCPNCPKPERINTKNYNLREIWDWMSNIEKNWRNGHGESKS